MGDHLEKIPDGGFNSPTEEVEHLRKLLAEKEQLLKDSGEAGIDSEQVASDIVESYTEAEAEQVLANDFAVSEEEAGKLAEKLGLTPEEDDQQMAELIKVVEQKGIRNAITIARRLKNPHLEDDLHRYLVQYLAQTENVPGLKQSTELYRALNMKLFEITMPETAEGEQKRSFKELISLMEQFYAGMQSLATDERNRKDAYFALEIALSNVEDQVVFYVSVPAERVDLLEKQIHGLYDGAKITEVADDYNIFNSEGASAGTYASSTKKDVLTLKTFDKFDNDPLSVILNVFSKMKHEGEGAAIQFLIRPRGSRYVQRFTKVLKELKKGNSLSQAANAGTVSAQFGKVGNDIVNSLFNSGKEEKKKEDKTDEHAIESVGEKIKSPIMEANIRIIASANTEPRAQDILRDLQSAFNQFGNTTGNDLKFAKLSRRGLIPLYRQFTYRIFSSSQVMRLNLKELSTMYHFPAATDSSPQLKQATAAMAPAPLEAPTEGLFLGKNKYRHKETDIYMARSDRVRHFYAIGQTGTGKTYFLRSLIKQDIENGDGCCFIDPHGSDINDILSYVPKERVDDVIYFDPAYAPRPMALNMLEYDTRFPEQKTFVVDEMLGIFNKLFDMKTAGGPMFEQYFRNATMLVIEDPDSGNTLLDISRVLADEKFRKMKIEKCKNPVVVQFWNEVAGKAGGEASLQNIVPYITSKFDVFLSNEIMRPIVAQPNSAFNFREIMDNKKILLVNLSKGRLGEINANLIGLILVGKILMAALSRADTADLKSLPPFYLYIDEFQNVTTDSIEQILSEARKYGLSLNIAHQFIAQLEEGIKNAVFGNVGSVATFRISPDDAKYLESRFQPVFSAADIMKIPNYNCYVQMLGNGTPMKPFNVGVQEIHGGRDEIVDSLKQLSYLRYGRDRDEVEFEIMKKYKKEEKPSIKL